MGNNTNIDQFKLELKALLKKHNVALGVEMEGDTYGIYQTDFVAIDNNTHKVHVVNGDSLYVDAKDIKETPK